MTDFEIYVERYCKKHRCSVEEAKKHALVKNVQKYYNETNKGVVR